jgi:hypothetical protein
LDPGGRGNGALDPGGRGNGALDPGGRGNGALDPGGRGNGALDPGGRGDGMLDERAGNGCNCWGSWQDMVEISIIDNIPINFTEVFKRIYPRDLYLLLIY